MAGLFGGIFGALCQNPQGEAMQVLNKEGGRLVQDWQRRVRRSEVQADRGTANIPVHPFHGLNDVTVEEASACGINPSICDSVDGDHSSIAKPQDPTHLTYRKLQSMHSAALLRKLSPSRFTVLSSFNNEAVRDNETGLVWEKSPAPNDVSWYVARNTCPNKNIGGRNGWRLPSFNELGSLRDPTATTNPSLPALPVGHPFTSVQTFGYWSATIPSNPTNIPVAYMVIFNPNSLAVTASGITDGSTGFTWCVFGPMNANAY